MKKLLVLSSFLSLFVLLTNCKKEQPAVITPVTPVVETDSTLFAKTIALTDAYYYKGNDTVYPSSSATAHNAFFRVRFNAIARGALTSDGKLPVGSTFPTGSLIVKELHLKADGSGMRGFAVMLKAPDDPHAVNGWVWAEYVSTTEARGILLTDKGSQCISCHSVNERDKVRLFDLFP